VGYKFNYVSAQIFMWLGVGLAELVNRVNFALSIVRKGRTVVPILYAQFTWRWWALASLSFGFPIIFLMKANAMIELYFKLIILSTFVLNNSTFLLLSDGICLCYCCSVADWIHWLNFCCRPCITRTSSSSHRFCVPP